MKDVEKQGSLADEERRLTNDPAAAWLEQQTAGPREVIAAACDAIGTPIPSAHKRIIGNHSKALLKDGFAPEMVMLAAVIALRRGQPQHMQFIASDLAIAQAGKRLTRREYERMLEDELELRGKP